MPSFTKMPIYSGVVPSPERRQINLAQIMSSVSYRNLQAVLTSVRKTALGYEWRVYAIDNVTGLFSVDGRKHHVLLRRKEKHHFLVSLVEPINRTEKILLQPEPYLSLLAKIKNQSIKNPSSV